MKKVEVVAAIFIDNQKLFAAKRDNRGPLALKWEFPGGKIEAGETKEQALVREIKEELIAEITVDEFFMTVKHQYPTFHLTMHTYLCTRLSSNFELKEHLDSKWVGVDELDSLDWAEADLPIVSKLKEYLNG